MFTGIITAMGRVSAARVRETQAVFTIDAPWQAASLDIGASGAGVCLTILNIAATDTGVRWDVECSPETLARTNLSGWDVGTVMNLERSLRMGDELGGHLVWGHVDGVGAVRTVQREGDHYHAQVEAPQDLVPLIAHKGSIAVDGVSLTVNGVSGAVFDLTIIPHTWAVTTLHALAPGSRVHLEADPIARYVARFLEARGR